MKRVTIKYNNLHGNQEVTAKTNDLAIRKMKDNYDLPIHTAAGRLSLDALLKRCSKVSITLESVNVNGKFTYEAAHQPQPTTQPAGSATAPASKPIIFRFMRSRFNSTCKETGRSIKRNETILFAANDNTNTKSAYCKDSNIFQSKKNDATIQGYELVKSDEIVESAQVVEEAQILEESAEPTADVKPVKATRSQTPNATPNNERALYDQFVAPYLDDIEIDPILLDIKIKDAIQKYTRRIEIVHTDIDSSVIIEGQHKDFDRLYKYCFKRKNVLLVGAAGTGKTHAAGEIAKLLNLEYASISVNLATQKHEFFGYMEATGRYVSTPFRKLFENGGVFLLDEFDAGNANALTAINMASANSSVTFPDGHIQKHKDFVLIASANTFGLGANYEYVGRNKLDAATRNRFAKMFWDYDEVMELMLTPNERWTKYCQNIRKVVADLKIKDVIISIRQMKDGGDMLDIMDRAEVEQDYIWADMKASDIVKIKEKVNW